MHNSASTVISTKLCWNAAIGASTSDSGRVAATVYQRPLTQGRVALQTLHQYLMNRAAPPANQRVTPFLVMRSNLDLVLERLSVDRAAHQEAVASGSSAPRPRRRK